MRVISHRHGFFTSALPMLATGEAAMRMGATFDPAFLDRVGLHARGDAAKALSWYRHALDLAAPKTDRQAQSSQAK